MRQKKQTRFANLSFNYPLFLSTVCLSAFFYDMLCQQTHHYDENQSPNMDPLGSMQLKEVGQTEPIAQGNQAF